MASTIAAVTTGGGGVVTTADASGNLSLLSGTTTVLSIASTGATVTGQLIQSAGANIASAATINLSTATGNGCRITGTTAISAVTMTTGQQVLVVADGALPLTYNATTNKLNSAAANVTLAAGDMVLYSKDLSGIVHGNIIKADGTAVVAPPAASPITNSIASSVTYTSTDVWFDGPTVAQGTSGTWFASGTISCIAPGGAENFQIRLYDGTTAVSATLLNTTTQGWYELLSISGYFVSPTGNIRIQGQAGNYTNSRMNTGLISVFRIV